MRFVSAYMCFFCILGQFWQHFGTAPCRLEIQSWCGLNSWLMVISFINEVEEFEDLKRFLNKKIKHSISQRFCHPVLIKMGTLLVLFNNRTKKQFCEFGLVPSPMYDFLSYDHTQLWAMLTKVHWFKDLEYCPEKVWYLVK